MCDEIGNNLASWSSMSQFDDLVWDEFEENTDHMVPEPDDDDDDDDDESSEQTTAWVTTTRRMMLQPQQQQVAVAAEQQQSFALVTKSGHIISQHSWGSRGDAVVQHGIIAEKKKETGFGFDMSVVELETMVAPSSGEDIIYIEWVLRRFLVKLFHICSSSCLF
jgi:hypothetical protein